MADYTLRLNITADGRQAVSEAQRVRDAMGAAGGPSSVQRIPVGALGARGAFGGFFSSGGSSVLGALGRFKTSFSAIGVVAGSIGTVFNVARSAMGAFCNFLTMPFKAAWGGALTAVKAVTVAIGAMAAGAYTAKKLLDPAGEMEAFREQMLVSTKSPKETSRRMRQLTKYAKDTNYSPGEVIGAANRLQAYGMYDFRTLKLAGDAANAFGKSIDEVVTSLSYMKAGRGGEAMESLSRFGVTRDKLKDYGVKFAKSGELKSSPEKAVKAILKYFEREYGGMTARIGKTWKGAMQQVGGEVFDAMARGFGGALKPATKFVTGALIPMITKLGNALQAIDWRKKLEEPLRLATSVMTALGNYADPRTRKQGRQQLGDLWDGFKAVGKVFLDGLGTVFQGAMKSIGSTIGNIVSGETLSKVFTAGISLFKAVVEAGLASLKTIVGGMPLELKLVLESVLEKIPMLGYKSSHAQQRERDTAMQFASIVAGDNTSNGAFSDSTVKDMMKWRNEKMRHVFGDRDLSKLSMDEMEYFMKRYSGDFEKAFGGSWINTNRDRQKKRQAADENAAWDNVKTAGEKAFQDMKDAMSSFTAAVDSRPITDALKEAGNGISDAWKKNVTPAVNRIHWQNSGRTVPQTYGQVRELYGKEYADMWGAEVVGFRRDEREAREMHRANRRAGIDDSAEWSDWNKGYRDRLKAHNANLSWILSEARNTRKAQSQQSAGTSPGSPKSHQESAREQLDVLKDVKEKISALEFRFGDIERSLKPISVAYSAA